MTTATVRSICVLCSHNCGVMLDVEDNEIVKVRADEENAFTHGYTCNKVYRIQHYVRHAQRVTEPQKRQPDGSYAPISWDQAVAEIGERARAIDAEHGRGALAFLGVGGQGNHLSVAFALTLLLGAGSRWWFNALAQEKTQRALVDGWMMRTPPDCMLVGQVEEADYSIILGSNPAISQRGPEAHRALRAIKKDPKRTLVVVDPRATETTRSADLHLPIRPGGDAYLMLAMAAIITQEGLQDQAFIEQKTRGYAEISAALAEVSVDDMAARCGLDAGVIRDVTQAFAAAERATMELDLGLEQSRFNTLTAYLLRLILAMTGNLGRPGGGVFVSTASPRGELSPPTTAPMSGLRGISLMVPVPMFSPAIFAEEVLNDHPDRIRAVIVEGSNPLLTYPGTPKVREAFDALALSVVIDPASTETAWVADYVLPTPVNYEKWELSNFPKPFPQVGLQLRPPALEGPDQALPEPEIYHRLALAMGVVSPAPRLLRWLARRASTPMGATALMAALAPLAWLAARGDRGRALANLTFWLYEALGPTLEAPQLSGLWLQCAGMAATRRADVLRAFPELAGQRNPIALGLHLYRHVLAHPEGAVLGRLDAEDPHAELIGYADGRVRLAPEPMLQEIRRALSSHIPDDPEYPFVLNGGMRTHWTANTNFRDPAWRKGRGPHCALRLSLPDAEALGVKKGDTVRVSSRVGAVELPVLPEAHVRVGHVHIPNGFGNRYPDPETGELRRVGVNINELTDPQDRDPFTGCPHHKFVRVRVERVA